MEIKEAIEYINWMRDKFITNKPLEAFDMAISALEKQDRWNPCSEKMPTEPFGCFVTVMDTNPITQEEFENILPYFVGWDGEQWNDADGERIPCEVLAWMPLPKPYKLEEES